MMMMMKLTKYKHKWYEGLWIFGRSTWCFHLLSSNKVWSLLYDVSMKDQYLFFDHRKLCYLHESIAVCFCCSFASFDFDYLFFDSFCEQFFLRTNMNNDESMFPNQCNFLWLNTPQYVMRGLSYKNTRRPHKSTKEVFYFTLTFLPSRKISFLAV